MTDFGFAWYSSMIYVLVYYHAASYSTSDGHIKYSLIFFASAIYCLCQRSHICIVFYYNRLSGYFCKPCRKVKIFPPGHLVRYANRTFLPVYGAAKSNTGSSYLIKTLKPFQSISYLCLNVCGTSTAVNFISHVLLNISPTISD